MENLSEPKWYDKTWLVVILCIVLFPVGLYAIWMSNTIAKGWKIGYTIFVALMIIANVGDKSNPTTVATTDTVTKADSIVTVQPQVVQNWSYYEDVDKMTSSTTYFAQCTANNKLYFEFPYDGGSVFTLILRKKGETLDLILNATKAQFVNINSNVRVKFDDKQPVNYDFSMANDGSANLIFISSPSTFIAKLKKAKHLIIEATFYQAGAKQVEFDVEGLKWEH